MSYFRELGTFNSDLVYPSDMLKESFVGVQLQGLWRGRTSQGKENVVRSLYTCLKRI